ncbi:MAG: flavodoxin-dependent (E)-4-hydroxy-3-methylbut-2-enyl-diphosphate synthase [Lachnospiraceae bacterium]|nr:flavodoxin-dependent (E)-4-hydroxy-3-methylbut-2-enyl-diphosphate synthase [Lachnospiraceae bacterium]
MYKRNDTKKIKIADTFIGGGTSIKIQSMCNTKTSDVESTVSQILSLEKEGCEIVRVSVPDEDSAYAISKIKEKIHIPLVADIHFDYRLAILSAKNGIDKIRINPGNIGDEDNIKKVVDVIKPLHIPIRVGVNSGSVSKKILEKYNGKVCSDALVDSAIENIKLLEKYDFYDTVISIKASDVNTCIDSYEKFASIYDYPLHIGITEAGTLWQGNIKSSVGLGILLHEGLGDTIRVSLSTDPVEEIKSAKMILKTLSLREGIEIVSCPTCARTNIDIVKISKKVEEVLYSDKELSKKNIKVAIMGCAVNGPGEAKEADIGIAGGDGEGLIIKKGEIIKKVKESDIIDTLIQEIRMM